MLMRRRLLAIEKRVLICRRGHADPRGSCLGTWNLFTTRAQVGDTFMIDHRYTVSTTIPMHRDWTHKSCRYEEEANVFDEVGHAMRRRWLRLAVAQGSLQLHPSLYDAAVSGECQRWEVVHREEPDTLHFRRLVMEFASDPLGAERRQHDRPPGL